VDGGELRTRFEHAVRGQDEVDEGMRPRKPAAADEDTGPAVASKLFLQSRIMLT
jgi:hypothetical protein